MAEQHGFGTPGLFKCVAQHREAGLVKVTTWQHPLMVHGLRETSDDAIVPCQPSGVEDRGPPEPAAAEDVTQEGALLLRTNCLGDVSPGCPSLLVRPDALVGYLVGGKGSEIVSLTLLIGSMSSYPGNPQIRLVAGPIREAFRHFDGLVSPSVKQMPGKPDRGASEEAELPLAHFAGAS
jgi:hypothetical protein